MKAFNKSFEPEEYWLLTPIWRIWEVICMMFPILSGIRFLLPIVWPIDWSQYELRFRMGQNKSSIRGFVFNFTSLHSIPLCVHWIFEGQPIVVYNFEHNLFTIHFISGFFVQMFLLLYLYTKWDDNVECIFIWSGHCNTPYVVHTQMLVNEWISSLFSSSWCLVCIYPPVWVGISYACTMYFILFSFADEFFFSVVFGFVSA